MSQLSSCLLLSGAFAVGWLNGFATTGRPGFAEAIVLTPQSGTEPEDLAIARWQEKARAPGAKSESFERLGWAYVTKARSSLDAGYYKLAGETADAIEERFGGNADTRLLRGHVLHNLHRFREAETIARGLVEERGLPADFALLSDVLMEQGDLAGSIEALQKMVNLKPGAEAYGRIAHVRWLKGDLAGAIESMELAVRSSSPDEPVIHGWFLCRLSGYYLQSGQWELALRLSDAVGRTAPQFASGLLARGRCLWALGRREEAIVALERATDLNPLPEYQWWLADALRAAGRVKNAQAVEEKLKAGGEAADPRTFALFLASRGESSKAAVKLAAAERINRQDIFTHDAYAWALAASGELAAANTEMQRALAEKTNDARLLLHAGVIAARLGEASRASEFFARAFTYRGTLAPSELALLESSHAAGTGLAGIR